MTASTVVSYTPQTAAEATGLSIDTIKRAIRAGDLKATRPKVQGRPIGKDQISAEELKRWVEDR